MRKARVAAPSPLNFSDENTLDLGLDFITPVFGGGVHIDGATKPPDPLTPIRGSAVRGQLRFWWRAMNPRGLSSFHELREAEGEIFGSTQRASAVRITVEQPQRGSSKPVLEGAFGAVDKKFGLAYGAFPLRGGKNETHGTLTEYRGQARLKIGFPSNLRKDVEAALSGWGRFGGLGGRTRRGFGAIKLSGHASFLQKPPDPTGVVVDWPHLSAGEAGIVRGARTFTSGEDALNAVLDTFKKFRQLRGDGNGQRPGRSKWPEPDAIRKLTGDAESGHATPITSVDSFPRAHFGMPIIFHFKDSGDPRDTTLNPAEGEGERLASPLILRPFPADGGFVAGAVRLFGTTPNGAVLEAGRTEHPVRVDLTAGEASSLIPLAGEPDPISAFMQRVKDI